VEKIDGYLADRGFIGTEFVRYLIKNEIKSRIRIRSVAIFCGTRNGVHPISGFAKNQATAMAFGGPRSSCVRPGAHSALRQDSRNGLMPCRIALHFISAGAHAPHSDETLGLRLRGGRRTPLVAYAPSLPCAPPKHNTRVARHRHGTAPARNFFRNLPRGEVIQLRGQRVVWGQKLSVTGTRLMSGESLIILSPDASQVTAILGDDKRRWEIETLFKALKSQGFDFEATHLTELDRIEKLLALLTIAFCWAHLLGEWLHEQKSIPIKSRHRPAIRIFRYGLD